MYSIVPLKNKLLRFFLVNFLLSVLLKSYVIVFVVIIPTNFFLLIINKLLILNIN